MEKKKRFKIGDIVRANNNPFDLQLGDYITYKNLEVTGIKDTSDLKGTSGQWVKIKACGDYPILHTDYEDAEKQYGWIDSYWFDVAL